MSQQQRIHKAAIEGEAAFWEVVAKHFPEIKTGDLDPHTSYEITLYLSGVIKTWLESNKP